MRKSKIDPIVLALGCTDKLMPDPMYVVSDDDIISRIGSFAFIHEKDGEGRTLLMYAALYERNVVVQYLISAGIDICAKDKNQYTALHFAVQANSLEIAETLLKAGAEVNAVDMYGNSPLMRCNNVSLSMVELLLKHGANPYQRNEYGVSAVDVFASDYAITNLFDVYSGKVQ